MRKFAAHRRKKRYIIILFLLVILLLYALVVQHSLNNDADGSAAAVSSMSPFPDSTSDPWNAHNASSKNHSSTSTTTTLSPAPYVFDPSVLSSLWPDPETRDAPPSFHDAVKTGLLKKNVMPYPSDVDDDPNAVEVVHDPEEYVDSPWITRADLMHVPTVYSIGLECFSDLRLTTFTRSSAFVGLEEREALVRYQRQLRAELSGEVDKEEESIEFDHRQHAHYYSYEYHHEQNVSFLSKPSASVPRGYVPKSEVLTRLIQGDAVYDPLGYQILDRYFAYERNMYFTIRNHFCDRLVQLMHIPDRPPLVVHLSKMQSFHFTVRCLYFRAQALTEAKRKFVLLTTEMDETPTYNFFAQGDIDPPEEYNVIAGPLYLLNHPLLAHWYSTNGIIRHPKFTPIPIGFQFYHRTGSLMPFVKKYQLEDEALQSNFTRHFVGHLNLSQIIPHITSHPLKWGSMSSMWLERALEIFCGTSVDPPVEIIPLDQLPERITTFYVVLMPIERYKRADRPSLIDDVIIFEEPSDEAEDDVGSGGPPTAQHIALIPFTVALYHSLLQQKHGKPYQAPRVVTAFTIWQWRWHWYDTLNQTRSIAVFPSNNAKNTLFELVREHSFVVSPPGNGYECYRGWEAVALGAIPILQNPVVLERVMHVVGGPQELDIGREINSRILMEPYRDLPVVFVDQVEDITLANLTKWQREIYHRAVEGKYKLEKLFMQYWVDMIYGHTNDD